MKTGIQKRLKNVLDVWNYCTRLVSLMKFIVMAIVIAVVIMCAVFKFEGVKNYVLEKKILSEDLVQFISNNATAIICTVLVGVIVVLCIVTIKVGKRGVGTKKGIKNCISRLHEGFTQKLQDGIHNLDLKEKRVLELRIGKNEEAIKEVYNQAFYELRSNLQSFVDVVAEFLSDYNNDIISVCIKVINSGQSDVKDEDKQAKTLVRSMNTNRERKKTNENITLGKNSDFKDLCNGTSVWFRGVDLKKMFENNEYENEADPRDWQKKYNSTIVLPINYCNIGDDQNINDILGFLCIDSKKIVKSWMQTDVFEVHYLSLFSEMIYMYIKKFRQIFEEG